MRRHRVAVDQQAGAECAACASISAAQRLVDTAPSRRDPALRLGEAQLAPIDRLARGDHARDGAEPGADPGAGGVDPGRQRVVEHRRVEFPRLAVGVAEGAREGGGEQRRAVLRRGGEQLVDETVLAAAQASAGRAAPRRGNRPGSRSPECGEANTRGMVCPSGRSTRQGACSIRYPGRKRAGPSAYRTRDRLPCHSTNRVTQCRRAPRALASAPARRRQSAPARHTRPGCG